jgi:flagellar basal body-associated protein FliL
MAGPPMSAPPGYPPGAYPPPFFPTPQPRKRRGLLITMIILVIFVLLAAGGGTTAYLLTRNQDGKGQPTAQSAVESFLEAVYVDQNATKAAALVCKAARDPKKIAAKIDQIKHDGQQYDNPRYTWSNLTTKTSTNTRAVISAKITLTTDDVQSATQTLTFPTIRSTGWFVCDVGSA